MAKPPRPHVVHSSGTPRERLTPKEWTVLRACWRRGDEATTAQIVGEVQKDALWDYRTVQTYLQRLVTKGYVRVEKQGPRRNVWTSVFEAEEVLKQEVRTFVDQVVGLEPQNIQLLRQVLDDLETRGPYVAFDESSLPRPLRVRLIALADTFIQRKRDRWALATTLGLERGALDGIPVQAGAISVLLAIGGDAIPAAVKLLDAIEELLESDEAAAAKDLAVIRQELQALS